MRVNKCKTISNSQVQNYQLVVIHSSHHLIHKTRSALALALFSKCTLMWKERDGKNDLANKQLLVLMSL